MSHEKATEKFFGYGIENYGTFHGNYLNFGLWEKGNKDYVKASEHLLTRVGKRIKLREDSLLLDVACGMGSQDHFFMKKFKCNKIEAIDLTKKHIKLAKERNKNNSITYTVGNACKLDFPENSFTHITGIEGPVNFNTREDFFKEAYRVLKDNGKLGISDFILAKKPTNALQRKLVKFCTKLWHIPSENADTVQSYRKKLERSGFTNVKIEVVSNKVIPGYFYEQKRKEIRKQLYSIRGQVIGRISFLIDVFTYLLYKMGLIGYVIVSAEKVPQEA